MYKHMGKVVIKILQGSAVTQTTLGGLTIYLLVANFLQCTCAKNYENWLAVDKVIAKIIRLTFFGPPCISWRNHVYILYSDYLSAASWNRPKCATFVPYHRPVRIRQHSIKKFCRNGQIPQLSSKFCIPQKTVVLINIQSTQQQSISIRGVSKKNPLDKICVSTCVTQISPGVQ